MVSAASELVKSIKNARYDSVSFNEERFYTNKSDATLMFHSRLNKYLAFESLFIKGNDAESIKMQITIKKLCRSLGVTPKLNEQLLSKTYHGLVTKTKLENPKQFVRTTYEIQVEDALTTVSNKELLFAYQIGPFTCDALIPSIGKTRIGQFKDQPSDVNNHTFIRMPERLKGRFAGLIIEVDGDVHDRLDYKIHCDQKKLELFHRLGIAVISIQNKSVESHDHKKIISKINDLPIVCSKTRYKLRRRIQLATLAFCGSKDQIEIVTNISSGALTKLANAFS